MKATAKAPANIAFIKYWGKADDDLRTPLNSSISMNLDGAQTTTTVEFSDKYPKDQVELLGGTFSDKEITRTVKALDRIKKRSGISNFARVVTANSFPMGTGAAASASGFAALTVAGFAAAQVKLHEKELSIFARLGSGSACRSIPDGFVIWEKGDSNESSFAYSLYPHDWWDLRDILVIVSSKMKKVSTTAGMEYIKSSPFLPARLEGIPDRINKTLDSLKKKNFPELGKLIEEDSINMHVVMMTQDPPLFYLNDRSMKIIQSVLKWREEGIPVYFTFDAGPNAHLICEGKDERSVLEKLKNISSIETIIVNKPDRGTRLIDKHLF